MADSTLDDIKSGKGIPPLSDSTSSNTGKSGITTSQQSDKAGITYEHFSRDSKGERRNK